MSTDAPVLECVAWRDAVRRPSACRDITLADVHRRVFSAEHLVLVELYGASQATNDPLLHALETIARRYVGRLDVVRLDALEAPSIAAEFFVSGLPALLLYQCGRVVDRIVGEVPMHRIIAMSEAHIRAA